MRIRTLGLAFVAAAIGTPAYAGSPDWTGFYAGLNGGWGWSHTAVSETPFGTTAVADINPHKVPTSMNGAVFGGQLGANWQMTDWVLGLEGDFDGAGLDGARAIVFPSKLAPAGNTDGFSERERVNWLASIRARVGITMGNGLAYITGGGAWEDKTTSAMISANTGPSVFGDSAAGKFSKTSSGFVVGGGYERQISPAWTLRGEYLFYDFAGKATRPLNIANCSVAGPCGVNVQTARNDVNVVRFAVNYLFNSD